jgi:hypothetical protein
MGSFVSMLGANRNAQAQDTMAAVYSQQGEQNQTLLNMSAEDTLRRGQYQAGVAGMRATQLIEKQRVGYATSGVDSQTGTPLQAMADTRMLSSLDQSMIRASAAREAWGLRVKGYQAYEQGQLSAYGAANGADNSRDQAKADAMQAQGEALTLLGKAV